MIPLPYGYYLDADKHQIILCTKREGGRYDSIGFYTTLLGALEGWTKKVVRDIIASDEVHSIHELLDRFRQVNEEAKAIIGSVDIRNS